MGVGIALLAVRAGFAVSLTDASEEARSKVLQRGTEWLVKESVKRNWTDEALQSAMSRLTIVQELEALAACDAVLEAVSERIEVKRTLFAQLSAICRPDALLLTNTSSLTVTEISGGLPLPDRMAGMHFFNPAYAMPLVEVVRGWATSDETVELVCRLAEALGKTPIVVQDSPGFIVNRVARPFHNESLRIYGDRVAEARMIDRILTKAGGFRMGPFELQDMIGIDINFAATTSLYERYYHESRFKPSRIQQQMVQTGKLGRKTGSGYYEYGTEETHQIGKEGRPPIEQAAAATLDEGCAGRVLVAGEEPLLGEMIELLRQNRYAAVVMDGSGAVASLGRKSGQSVCMAIEMTNVDLAQKRRNMQRLEALLPQAVPILTTSLALTATEIAAWTRSPDRVCGFGTLVPLPERELIEIAPALQTAPGTVRTASAFIVSLGKEVAEVDDAPGLVFPRVLALIVNEAAFALQEGIAPKADIDRAMVIGTNYPLGPLAWGDQIGLDVVHAIVGGLHREFAEERYRPAPLLRKLVLAGWHGVRSGTGFYAYTDNDD